MPAEIVPLEGAGAGLGNAFSLTKIDAEMAEAPETGVAPEEGGT